MLNHYYIPRINSSLSWYITVFIMRDFFFIMYSRGFWHLCYKEMLIIFLWYVCAGIRVTLAPFNELEKKLLSFLIFGGLWEQSILVPSNFGRSHQCGLGFGWDQGEKDFFKLIEFFYLLVVYTWSILFKSMSVVYVFLRIYPFPVLWLECVLESQSETQQCWEGRTKERRLGNEGWWVSLQRCLCPWASSGTQAGLYFSSFHFSVMDDMRIFRSFSLFQASKVVKSKFLLFINYLISSILL